MLKQAALTLAALLSLTLGAEAGGRRVVQYRAPAASAGTVNNFYGPTTVYQGSAPAYGYYDYGSAAPATAPSYGNSYAGAYAGAYANGYSSGSYGAEYGAPWGPPFAGGVGYSPYGYYGGYGSVTVPFYSAGRQDPWNGYNGGWGNGYW